MGVAGAKSLPSVAKASSRLTSAGAAMTRGFTLPVLGAAAVAGKLAYDFDASMQNVNSIAQLPQPQLDKLKQSVLDLAGPTAQSPQTLSEALYDLVSSGFDAKDSMQILKSSATAATAGLTDAATSTKAISAVLNAYQLPAKKAGFVSDVLFQTVNRGVVTFEELASTIGKTLPIANTLGVGVDQLGASISTLTKQGFSGAEANTAIRGALVQLIKPTEGLKDAYKELGVSSGQELVKKTGSYQGALEALVGTTDGSAQAVGKMFTNQRALSAVLGVTGKNAKAAEGDVKGFKDVIGATDTALGEQKKSVAYKFHQLSANLQALAIKAAPPVLDALSTLMGIVAALGGAFSGLPAPLQHTLVMFLLISAAIGPLIWLSGKLLGGWVLLFGGIGKLLWGLERLRQAWIAGRLLAAGVEIQNAGLAASFFALDASVLLIPLAIALLIGGLVLLYLKVKWFRDAVNAVVGWIGKHLYVLLGVPVIGQVIVAIVLLVRHWQDVRAAAVAAFHWILQAGKDTWGWLKTAAHNVVEWFKGAGRDISGAFKTAFSAVKGVVDKFLIKPMQWLLDKLQWFIDKVEGIRLPWQDQVIHAKGTTLKGPGSNPFDVGAGAKVPRGAAGFSNFPGGLAVVGEQGAELAHLPKGTNLHSHVETKGILSAIGGGSRTIIVPVSLDGKQIAKVVAKHADTAKARR